MEAHMATRGVSEAAPPAPARALPEGRPPDPLKDAAWDDLILGSFGPRHWNLGCG